MLFKHFTFYLRSSKTVHLHLSMYHISRLSILFYSVLFSGLIQAQALVSLNPPFPTGEEAVVVTFDASQGNAGLNNLPLGSKVYAHTGITVNGTNWQNVGGTWGADNGVGLMTRVGASNIYTLSMTPSIRQWYATYSGQAVAAGSITKLCLVFRNADGSKQGKTTAGQDIFVDLATNSFSASITSHPQSSLLLNTGQSITFIGQASASSLLNFSLDGNSVGSQAAATALNYTLNSNDLSAGLHTLIFTANNGVNTLIDTIKLTKHAAPNTVALPSNGEEGISYPTNTSAYLQLRAPGKDFIYVLGDFNDWSYLPEYQMKKSPDGQFFWIEIPNLNSTREYRFQYSIGWEGLRVTDPYVEKVLDPYNDPYIDEARYPGLIDYPTGITEGVVGILQCQENEYAWDNSYTFTKPAREDLVVYELLIRDFSASRTYSDVIDRLPYLATLGINAVQLMPVAEFEGNESWGYGTDFFMAPDKYYGPKNELKRLIDSCHARGIAIILDVVFNHSFGLNPMVKMYFNPSAGQYGQPTANSPWFNPIEKHPFNVGYDFNHESAATKYFVKKVTKHWINEYKIDGYRFDLSKGFTQKNTLGDVGAWGQYDQSRINIILDYANSIRTVDPNSFLILEHFAESSEEVAYANVGMMVWAKGHTVYEQASMGYITNSNLYDNTHWSRGWNNYGMMAYMESHDEERIMYKNLNFGNSVAGYNIKTVPTACERMSLAATFLLMIPGPKMIWQFGELGYDYSINYCTNGTLNANCKTGNKPVRWDYYLNADRKKTFETYRKLNYLKTNYPVFRDLNCAFDLGQYEKLLKFNSNDLDAVIVGNFDVVAQQMNPGFTQTGTWYDYLNGTTINVNNTNDAVNLGPGEFHVFLNQNIVPPENSYLVSPNGVSEIPDSKTELVVYPNPFNSNLYFRLPETPNASSSIIILDITGRKVLEQTMLKTDPLKTVTINAELLTPGMYVYHVNLNGVDYIGKLIKP